MFEVLARLFDTTGFSPRRLCGDGWTPSLIWLHITSDLFIWLAYVSIPLVLLYFTRRRDLPFPRLFVLFALFILFCGTTHLTEAIIFDYPIYRFAGVMKFLTAVVSWVTVIALIRVIPRVMHAMTDAAKPGADTKLHRPLAISRPSRLRDYIIAVLAAVLAVLIRAAIEPVIKADYVFVLPLLAVVYVSWQHGFGPGILCLVISTCGYAFFFISPKYSLFTTDFGTQFVIALFFFCGVACAALGEAQQTAQRRAKSALASAVARQEELESEIVRRRVVEAALRQRETELVAAQRETAEALARLNAFLDNAPVGIAFFDPELRCVRINPFLAAANGRSVAEHTGRTISEVIPDFPPEILNAYQSTVGQEGKSYTTQLRRPDVQQPEATRVWQVTAFPVRQTQSRTLGTGVFVQDVTDRLKAEEELRRSERNLADFFENANVGLHWISPDGIILRANKAELEMLGYRREEYVGRPLEEFHTDPAANRNILERLKRGERLDKYPARLRCKDGRIRDVEIAASALWENGQLVHSRCFTRDVTELKQAMDALRESEERFRSMADSAPALIWLSELDGRRTYFDKTWLKFTGRTTAEELNYGWVEDIYPEDRDLYLGEYTAAFENCRPFEVEYRLRRHDGVIRWVLARGVPRFTQSGGLSGFVGICMDVTDRREATEAVRRSEERYRVLTEAVPHIVWNASAVGEVTYFNQRWLEYTAVSLEEAGGEGWLEAIHPDDRERVRTAWREMVTASVADQSNRFAMEFRLRQAQTGEYRWFLSAAVPLLHSDGRVDQWIGSMADIHDQKSAAEAIRASEAFRRSVFENTPDCVMILDLEGRLLELNGAGQRAMEIADFATLRDTPWAELWPAANRETVVEAVAAARAGEVGRFQGFCPTMTSTPKYWDVSIAALPGPDGNPHRLIGVARDITEERRAEERIRESEEMFRQLAESIPQLAWMADPDGYIFWYNQRWYDYTGTTFEEMKGSGWETVHDPSDLTRVVTKFKAHLASGEVWEDTFALRGKDGKFRWHLSRARPMRDASGTIVRWFGTNTDISAQREMEQSLRASEQRFRTLTEAVPQMVWTADPQGAVTFFNRRWDEYTGKPWETIRGREWGPGLVHRDDVEELRTDWRQAVGGPGKPFSHEFRLRRASDDAYRWMLGVAVPLTDPKGTIVEWVGTLTDIEDQKRHAHILEKLVHERTAELERSNEELEKFAYVASHDLQEPLRKIQAFGDRLVGTCSATLPPQGLDYLKRMRDAAGRMQRLIDDLLTFSRITTQQRPFAHVDLGKMLNEIVSDLEVRLSQTNGTVRIHSLPVIEADYTQMRQLFQNLLVNAVKFHRPGVPPVVEVEGKLLPDSTGSVNWCELSVRDNGIGFDEKYRDRIFDVFQRLHSRDEYEGTGVGLAICRKIVERHGGTITAHSREGEGATFVVVLPLRQSNTHEAIADDVQQAQADHNTDGRR